MKKIKKLKGFTLIEALMAIFIFGIGMTGSTLLFAHAWKNNAYTIEMGQSSMAVSRGVGIMVEYLRGIRQADNGSYPIKSADENDLVVYSDYDRDNVTERLHFYKSGTDILMGVTDPTATMPRTYPAGDQSVATIASRIVNASSEPIFYYYEKGYFGDPTVASMATPATVADIRVVKIHLHINIDPNRAPDNIEMQTLVELRNLNDYDRVK